MRSDPYKDNDTLSRWLGLLLIAATISAYWYLPSCDFILFDDPQYVFSNDRVRSGLNWPNITWAFTTLSVSNWHPLTWLSYMLDTSLFGINPAGFHSMNLLFHLGNTLLLFLLLRETSGRLWESFIVAALFALHPLHVESVAWISERKDVLSTFFWLLALLTYVRYVKQPRTLRYLLVLFLFALGLMSKPMVVTLPFVLLLMDYWPLERIVSWIHRDTQTSRTVPFISKTSLGRLVFEKTPFFMLSIASCVITFIAQSEAGAVIPLESFSIMTRIENSLISYCRYIIYMIWPKDLTVYHPHPGDSIGVLPVVICGVALIALTGACVSQVFKRPYLLFGWLWYLGTLVPVIGLVQVGDQAMADRYTYIPLIGLFIALVWGFSDLFGYLGVRRILLVTFTCTVLFALGNSTVSQVHHWQNTRTLFEYTLDVTENNYLAHFILAQLEAAEGNGAKAFYHHTKAIELNPAFVAKMINREGFFLAERGQWDEAATKFEEAIGIRPDYANARNNLGVVLARKGLFDEAVDQFTRALEISPTDKRIRESLRNAELERNRLNTALETKERSSKYEKH